MENFAPLYGRLYRDYFSDASRRLRVKRGEILIDKDIRNDKLYYILSGTFAGTIAGEDELGDEKRIELFLSGPGAFIGVISFFSESQVAFMRVSATTDAEVAWIDIFTEPVNEAEFGSLHEQFLPVIMGELVQRQINLSRAANERESALHRLHLSEQLTTLGRLSAGIAHELNNAVGVLSRTADHLRHVLKDVLHMHHPDIIDWFERGVESGQEYDSETVRRRGKEISAAFGIPYEKGKDLARITGDMPLPTIPDDLDLVISLWDAGRSCHDMQLAARHAANIVKSVKELGGTSQQRGEGVDVNATLHEAISLLQSYLRKVAVSYNLATDLPRIWGNRTELVQIWINIIRNACEALRDAHAASPCISIISRAHKRGIEIILTNNGPPIQKQMLRNLFHPHITTKKGAGGSMGMGLGLYLVKRLVDSYSGELHVESDPALTLFSVRLPLHHEVLDYDE